MTRVDWVMFSSGVPAIAQADLTKHANAIPIIRRIGMHRILLVEHPLDVRNKSHCPIPVIWMGEGMQIGGGPLVPNGTGPER